MKTALNKVAALLASMFAFGLTASSCTDYDSTEKPLIYTQVEILYGFVGGGTGVDSAFVDNIAKYGDGGESLIEACSEYNEARRMSGNAYSLATESWNGGFYMSAYILLYNMHQKARTNNAATDFEAIFYNAGCTGILADAKDAYNRRAIPQ